MQPNLIEIPSSHKFRIRTFNFYMFCHKCMSCPLPCFGNTNFSLRVAWQCELVLIIGHFHFWPTWIPFTGRRQMKGGQKWRECPQPTIPILIISLFGVIMINTPGKNRHQLFVDFVREDFAEFFSPDWKSCLSADESADILGSGNVRASDGQMDRGRCSRRCNNAGIQPTPETGNLDLLGKSSDQIYLLPGGNRPNKPELSAGV